MNVEPLLFNALKDLVAGHCYRDVAPLNAAKPCITFQQVGGEAVNFLHNADPVGIRNARVQVNCWSAASRDEATVLAHQAEDALRAYTALQVTVLGSAVSIYEPETFLFGSMQDFSCWTDT